MNDNCITNSIRYVGVNDKTLDLFESQYKIPNGVSYNSYVILDEKIAVMDTVDKRALGDWIINLETTLEGKNPDYLVISHLEPDHAANIKVLTEKYPDMKLVGNEKIFEMLPQFFDMDIEDKKVVVKEGDELNLGKHTLQFFMAPMVHWPEVMVEYEKTEKILFSADGFGKFGALDVEEDWTDEARRYYINIVGKYGSPVQALLKKAATLDIQTICPLHGPVLKENLGYYIDKYVKWSTYEPEEEGVVVAYASIHGNTASAAREMAEILKEKGAKNVIVHDLSRADMAAVIADCYRYDKLVVASPTYDAGLFPCMEDFLLHLKHKNYQKRKVGVIENGSWATLSGKCMKNILEQMKNITICDTMVSIKSVAKTQDFEAMKRLADEILK